MRQNEIRVKAKCFLILTNGSLEVGFSPKSVAEIIVGFSVSRSQAQDVTVLGDRRVPVFLAGKLVPAEEMLVRVVGRAG
jgi:hypothetical protein